LPHQQEQQANRVGFKPSTQAQIFISMDVNYERANLETDAFATNADNTSCMA
jgi:hypothetical protein